MSLETVLAKYRADSENTKELGSRFEELMRRYLLTDPQYSDIIEWAVLWENFFAKRDFGIQDTGIDLVAKTVDGEYWAVQCKCYAEGHQVTKSDVGTKKMKIDPEKGTIQYNDFILISGIPPEAFQYVVNGRSTLAWIAEMYRVTIDKDTGIVNDPNKYAGGKYIFDLIGSVVTVSVETVKIQNSLPQLIFEDGDGLERQ